MRYLPSSGSYRSRWYQNTLLPNCSAIFYGENFHAPVCICAPNDESYGCIHSTLRHYKSMLKPELWKALLSSSYKLNFLHLCRHKTGDIHCRPYQCAVCSFRHNKELHQWHCHSSPEVSRQARTSPRHVPYVNFSHRPGSLSLSCPVQEVPAQAFPRWPMSHTDLITTHLPFSQAEKPNQTYVT